MMVVLVWLSCLTFVSSLPWDGVTLLFLICSLRRSPLAPPKYYVRSSICEGCRPSLMDEFSPSLNCSLAHLFQHFWISHSKIIAWMIKGVGLRYCDMTHIFGLQNKVSESKETYINSVTWFMSDSNENQRDGFLCLFYRKLCNEASQVIFEIQGRMWRVSC